jgi:hypothetical protein
MAGSSIAAPSAAPWVTDFLNAAYYARARPERHVRDLRLAHGIITTRWASGQGRLGATDVLALNRAYGGLRLRSQGRLDQEALLQGATSLAGDWFPAAWVDPERRAHGVAFARVEERMCFVPGRRVADSALRPLSPPRQPPSAQHWATYDPVPLPDPDAALALLLEPARWPDIGSAGGRFTALRDLGLRGQTFEIEVVAEPTPRSPIFTRGYVTCTTLLLRREEPAELDAAVAELGDRHLSGAGPAARPMLPDHAEPLALVVLTTHEGHFLGSALSHLIVWRDREGAWIRDVGAWDPLPLHLAATYRAAGRAAQHEFWGPTPPERSMLAQLALVSGEG